MPRGKNTVETVQITVSTTELIRDYLEDLAKQGLYGKNPADAANFLLSQAIQDLIERNLLERRPAP